jgi:hypothetical protein
MLMTPGIGTPITQREIDAYLSSTTAQMKAALDLVITPVEPQIVQRPKKPLTNHLIAPLPVMTPPSAAGAVQVLGHGTCGVNYTLEDGHPPMWICTLGPWVSAHPVLALAVVVGTYMVVGGRKK